MDTAAEHGQEVLHKYLATHATGLIKDGQATQALQLYRKYGCPTFPQNFNIYKRIAVDLFGRYSHHGPAVSRFLVSNGSTNGTGCLRGLLRLIKNHFENISGSPF